MACPGSPPLPLHSLWAFWISWCTLITIVAMPYYTMMSTTLGKMIFQQTDQMWWYFKYVWLWEIHKRTDIKWFSIIIIVVDAVLFIFSPSMNSCMKWLGQPLASLTSQNFLTSPLRELIYYQIRHWADWSADLDSSSKTVVLFIKWKCKFWA